MPAVPSDARDMLIAATQSPDPVIYIDDRWCYEEEDYLIPAADIDISTITPVVRKEGSDVTLAAAGFSVLLCLRAAEALKKDNISCEVVDLRQINPFSPKVLVNSVAKTGRLIAVDGGWSNSGFSSEIIASVAENLPPQALKSLCVPMRLLEFLQ
jgi:pyruvate dehydrogenase E1 component beta subunit